MNRMKKLKVGGRITFHACGNTTYRNVMGREKFIAAAASHWFWCTDSNPARTISAMKAAAITTTAVVATQNTERFRSRTSKV